MSDLKLLVIAILDDLYSEELESIKNDIFKLYKKDFDRLFSKKIPLWYKELLTNFKEGLNEKKIKF